LPNETDLNRYRQYTKVLCEVTAGDTLGPPQANDTDQACRQFELSGNLYPAALIDRMIAEKLLAPNTDRGVIMGAEGERFYNRHR
jgi:hypothetical protein